MAYEQYGFNDNKTKYDLSSLDEIQNRISNMETTVLNRVYPVGCVYWSKNKVNPGRPASEGGLGIGTWAKVSTQHRVIAVVDPDGKTGALATGGDNEKYITADRLPDHAHRVETTTLDNTEDPNNRWGDSKSKINPWAGVRVVPMGTGGTTGITPWHLGYEFGIRRGYGETVEMVKAGPNTTVKSKDSTYSEFNNSFALETTAGKTKQTQLPQSVNMDITANTKITGFTGPGVYTKDAWANSTINSNGTVTYTDLAQQKFNVQSAYITLYGWYRTA